MHGRGKWLICPSLFNALLLTWTLLPVLKAAEEEILIDPLASGGRALLVQLPSKEWGLRVEMPGMASATQTQPVRLKIYESEAKITDVAAGYRSVRKTPTGLLCEGQVVPVEGLGLRFEDVLEGRRRGPHTRSQGGRVGQRRRRLLLRGYVFYRSAG